MESQLLGIKNKVQDPQALRDNPGRESHAIKPTPRDEGALLGRFGRNMDGRQPRKSPSLSPGKSKDANDELRNDLVDITVSTSTVNFEIYDKAGGLVVRTIGPDASEVSTGANSDDSPPKLLEKGEKPRGVLFARKA